MRRDSTGEPQCALCGTTTPTDPPAEITSKVAPKSKKKPAERTRGPGNDESAGLCLGHGCGLGNGHLPGALNGGLFANGAEIPPLRRRPRQPRSPARRPSVSHRRSRAPYDRYPVSRFPPPTSCIVRYDQISTVTPMGTPGQNSSIGPHTASLVLRISCERFGSPKRSRTAARSIPMANSSWRGSPLQATSAPAFAEIKVSRIRNAPPSRRLSCNGH